MRVYEGEARATSTSSLSRGAFSPLASPVKSESSQKKFWRKRIDEDLAPRNAVLQWSSVSTLGGSLARKDRSRKDRSVDVDVVSRLSSLLVSRAPLLLSSDGPSSIDRVGGES